MKLFKNYLILFEIVYVICFYLSFKLYIDMIYYFWDLLIN